MKKYLVLAVIASAALPALAGDTQAKEPASGGGFDCCNMCPLAQQANTHRSSGRESFSVSSAMRSTFAAAIQKNLARV